MTYFVLIPGLRGPEAQLWADAPIDGNGKSTVKPLFSHKLRDDEKSLSLDDLILKFKDHGDSI